jgi:lipase chaperone LimK
MAAGPNGSPKGKKEDELHGQIVGALKQKVQRMFEEASKNPDSEASEMVHILLLNQLTSIETQPSEKELKAFFGEEHRRQQFKVQLELAKSRLAQAKKMGEERLKMMKQKLRIEQQKARDLHQKSIEAGQLAKAAKAAAERGQPMDSMEVYNRIAEIVGLHAPLKPIGPIEATGDHE